MTYRQRLKKMAGFTFVVSVVWAVLRVWEYRGMPPHEVLADLAWLVCVLTLTMLVIETVIHLVRRARA